ncbi:MAG: homocysteine S-methyltransferase family protein [Firmicutes bacterium]|nr:homocysteine S-methyltransferase family protein [Bacillota bacterium]
MLREDLKHRRLYYDGATGTYLASRGLEAGELPELLNIRRPDILIDMHRAYLAAGADIILSNTFGANALKFKDMDASATEIIRAGVANAKKAVTLEGRGYVSLDIGPLGRILEPVGDLPFEEAYTYFAEMVEAGAEAGADLITIETMSDTYEIKAAVLAAKEHSDLPVFATAVFQEDGRMLTGCDIETFLELVTSLGVDAAGMNCSFGPEQMLPLMAQMAEIATIPLIANPNAGLPVIRDGETAYDVDDDAFADYMVEFAKLGVPVLGGCCGTLPSYIEKTVRRTKTIPHIAPKGGRRATVSSYTRTIDFDRSPVIIGERLNPTGKKHLQRALIDGRTEPLLAVALSEEEDDAHVLDVNAGVPGLDEARVLPFLVQSLQGVTDLPLQIDTTDPDAMDKAARIYNGKPLLNSVSGKRAVMEAVFPVARKYGALCVALLLDDDGIPETANGRMAVAEAILREGARYGLSEEDFLFDPLAMAISSDPDGAVTVLETLSLLKKRGLRTVLGVSNISFGLPERDALNAHFYAMCLASGLNAGIVNPSSPAIRAAYRSSLALLGYDAQFSNFLDTASNELPKEAKDIEHSLSYAVAKGLDAEAAALTKKLLQTTEPVDIIRAQLVPALDSVGQQFEAKTLYLPQLLRAADAAAASFNIIRAHMEEMGTRAKDKGRIVVATVKGDIHDIGKNIAKALLENYGFDIIDLGKDVDPRHIVDVVKKEHILLVGLSALMTTTVPFMEETIHLLHKEAPEAKIMVGGAVLTEDYAKKIHADAYCRDAMASVRYAQEVFQH